MRPERGTEVEKVVKGRAGATSKFAYSSVCSRILLPRRPKLIPGVSMETIKKKIQIQHSI